MPACHPHFRTTVCRLRMILLLELLGLIRLNQAQLVSRRACTRASRTCYPRETLTAAELDNIMQTNLYAPIYLTRAITRQWLNVPVKLSESSDVRGQRDEQIDLKKKIILISSISGQIVNRPQCQMAYNASKAGLTMVGKVSFRSACLRTSGEKVKRGVEGKRRGSRNEREEHFSLPRSRCTGEGKQRLVGVGGRTKLKIALARRPLHAHLRPVLTPVPSRRMGEIRYPSQHGLPRLRFNGHD